MSTNPRIRCQSCALVLTNFYIRCAPMLVLPRLQGFSITLKDEKILLYKEDFLLSEQVLLKK